MRTEVYPFKCMHARARARAHTHMHTYSKLVQLFPFLMVAG
jgi:hypothetical protein